MKRFIAPTLFVIGLMFGSLVTYAWAEAPAMPQADLKKAIAEVLREDPSIMEEALAVVLAQNDMQVVAHKKSLHDEESPSVGPADAKVTVVEFIDYNCGYCKKAATVLAEVIKETPDVRFVFKELPIIHSTSSLAAKAALASDKQGKYFDMHMALMNTPGPFTDEKVIAAAQTAGLDVEKLKADMAQIDIEAISAKNKELAINLGVRGTPAFVVGGRLIPGFREKAELTQAIEEAKK